MMFPEHIFKAYDIRGLTNGELSDDLAYRVGRGFIRFLRKKGVILPGRSVVVGRDMRASSPGFQKEVIRGIQDEGVNVVDIGMCSTPLFNFSCAHFPEYAGGIMVTASHNPAEYNGFKLTLEDGLPVPGSEMYTVVVSEYGPRAEVPGSVSTANPLHEYFKKIFSLIAPNEIRPLKIVIDFGNGMGATTFQELLRHVPQVKAEFLFVDPDGTFPNHEANPLKTETLASLQKKVLETKADLGFALDGDADRIGLVDETGSVVAASTVAAVIGLEVLKAHPRATMLYTPNCSQIVRESWEKQGATTHMCPVGHAKVKRVMKETGAAYGGEISLHVFFHDVYNLECSDLALMYILKIVSQSGERLSDIVRPFSVYSHSGEINFQVPNKDAVLKKIEDHYLPQAIDVSYVDGVWIRTVWGWLSVRTSNTEPLLRLNLEAIDIETMRKELERITSIIRSA